MGRTYRALVMMVVMAAVMVVMMPVMMVRQNMHDRRR